MEIHAATGLSEWKFAENINQRAKARLHPLVSVVQACRAFMRQVQNRLEPKARRVNPGRGTEIIPTPREVHRSGLPGQAVQFCDALTSVSGGVLRFSRG